MAFVSASARAPCGVTRKMRRAVPSSRVSRAEWMSFFDSNRSSVTYTDPIVSDRPVTRSISRRMAIANAWSPPVSR